MIVDIALEKGCDGLVVGLPVTRAGSLRDANTDSRVGRLCRNFAITLAAIAQRHSLRVFLVDEADTTKDAVWQQSEAGRKKKRAAVRCFPLYLFWSLALLLRRTACV